MAIYNVLFMFQTHSYQYITCNFRTNTSYYKYKSFLDVIKLKEFHSAHR